MPQSYRMLVVDDDDGLREYLQALASSRGFQVFAAPTGEEAIATLERSRPDLVTLDLVLPGMDGLETLKQLKERLPEVPVIMLSGHGQARSIVEAMKLGAADFLRKPFEVEELEVAFQKALEKRALKQEVEELRGRVRSEAELLMLCGDDPKMREVREIIEQVADTDITVLVRGESGTGKELVARALHRLSGRVDRPFVKVNCAALPSELLESELFGFEKGAFTGAQRRKLGKFEYANHGTIFLDEISEMHPALQAKLLQVLQDGEFSRLGGESDVHVDTRVIAATNRNLETAVSDGSFREDLFYRLNVVTVQLPPLRERKDAIPLLVDHFLTMYNRQYGKSVKQLQPRHARGLPRLPVAGQRARTREHREADGRARERAGHPGGDHPQDEPGDVRPTRLPRSSTSRRSASISPMAGASISRQSPNVPPRLPRRG